MLDSPYYFFILYSFKSNNNIAATHKAMTFFQAPLPISYSTKPSKKFLRRHKAYLLNQKKALINKKVDQLANQQAGRKLPFFAPINTPNGDLLVASDMDISQESDSTDSSEEHTELS
jgi:hypothetical protein